MVKIENTNKYASSKIYKIVNDIDDDIYIGSTTKNALSNRMSQHRTAARLNKQNGKLYQTMRGSGIEHFSIILIENDPCNSRDELRAREHHWIKELVPTLNMIGAMNTPERVKATHQKYYINNIDRIKAQSKQYRVTTNYNQCYYEKKKDDVRK
jgi:hypothetical protein